jgi:hypothetical protein
VHLASSMDDIKAQYRKLAKELHPDLNPAASAAKKFNDLVLAYEWLLDNHKPVIVQVLTDLSDILGTDRFFRTFLDVKEHVNIFLPLEKIERKTAIFCMINSTEVRIILNPGILLPHHIAITNLPDPYTIHILEESEPIY